MEKRGKGDKETLADKSAFCRLDAREVRLLCSTEHGLLLCSIIFPTSSSSSPYFKIEKKKISIHKKNQTKANAHIKYINPKQPNSVFYSADSRFVAITKELP